MASVIVVVTWPPGRTWLLGFASSDPEGPPFAYGAQFISNLNCALQQVNQQSPYPPHAPLVPSCSCQVAIVMACISPHLVPIRLWPSSSPHSGFLQIFCTCPHVALVPPPPSSHGALSIPYIHLLQPCCLIVHMGSRPLAVGLRILLRHGPTCHLRDSRGC